MGSPYRKPNNPISYIHTQSNHPPNILKNLPLNVEKYLSSLSSTEEIFNEASPPYQQALKESGFTHTLTYHPPPSTPIPKRCRTRKVTWFNPPFSKTVASN